MPLTYNPAPIRTSGGVANARKTQEDTVAITAHLPREIRDRLKILASRERRTMNEMIAEALEDLFRKHAAD